MQHFSTLFGDDDKLVLPDDKVANFIPIAIAPAMLDLVRQVCGAMNDAPKPEQFDSATMTMPVWLPKIMHSWERLTKLEANVARVQPFRVVAQKGIDLLWSSMDALVAQHVREYGMVFKNSNAKDIVAMQELLSTFKDKLNIFKRCFREAQGSLRETT